MNRKNRREIFIPIFAFLACFLRGEILAVKNKNNFQIARNAQGDFKQAQKDSLKFLKKGSQVFAKDSGIVLYAGRHKFLGKVIFLLHKKNIRSRYYGLESLSVSSGQFVKKGQILGRAQKKGVSCQKTGLIKIIDFFCPIKRKKFIITSRYGRRKKPSGDWGFHNGLDLASKKGTPVYAAAEGTVLDVGKRGAFGNMVLLKHKYGLKTRYAHLSKSLVRKGQKIRRKQLIGKVGNTGNVWKKKGMDGSHLHFEVYVAGMRVDPLYFLAGKV